MARAGAGQATDEARPSGGATDDATPSGAGEGVAPGPVEEPLPDFLMKNWKGILATCGVAFAVSARDWLRNAHHYVAPSSAAVLAYAFLPRVFKRYTLTTLFLLSIGSVALHRQRQLRALGPSDTPRGLTVRPERPRRGQVALVTGASSGIGMEIAKELARRGYGLVLVARREKKLQELAAEIRSSLKASGVDDSVAIHTVRADLGGPDEAQRLHDRVTRGLNVHVSMLVNNAGVGYAEDFTRVPLDKVDEIVGLNVIGLTKLTRLFAADMASRGEGHIMTVSSIAGVAPGPYVAIYSATKAYVNSFTHALQHELEPFGVHVTLLMPGATFTEFQQSANADKALCFLVPGMAMSAHDVAVAAVEGFLRGDTVVIPGLVNQIYVAMTSWLPPKITRLVTEVAWR